MDNDVAILDNSTEPQARVSEPAVHSGEGTKVIRACTINQPADVLYAFWRQFENLPRIMKNLISLTQTTTTESHWVAKGTRGKPVEWDAVIINEHRNELIAWKTPEDSPIRHAGSIRFNRAPGNQGTEVVIAFEYDLRRSDVKFLTRFFGKTPGETVAADLARFKALMETGEIPTTEGQSAGGKQKEEQE